MKVWMLWHGGSSYSHGDASDIEDFDSLRACIAAFDARQFDSYYPCVSDAEAEYGGPSGWLWLADPRVCPDTGEVADTIGDLYPDRIIEYGPRGGVRVTMA